MGLATVYGQREMSKVSKIKHHLQDRINLFEHIKERVRSDEEYSINDVHGFLIQELQELLKYMDHF